MAISDAARFAAIDLGASSGRVIVATISAGEASLQEVHRFPNTPVRVAGTLHWDILALYRGILDGLRAADRQGPIAAVGVDSWAVDYGLVTGRGTLLGNPVHYRDSRTEPAVAEVTKRVGAQRLYEATGIAQQPFNTIFQLVAESHGELIGRARHALLIPDLLTYWLCGAVGTELTNASTTALVDPRSLQWDTELADAVGIDLQLFAPLVRPGVIAGELRPDVQADAALAHRPQVAVVPSHDTAAAVAGVPATQERFAFVSTGTWALVGVTLAEPVINEASRAANFTNEVAADGTIRFLRNVTGFWLLQECVREWRAAGHDVDAAQLTAAAAEVPPLRAIIDVQDPAFLPPGGMPRRISEHCERRSGQRLQGPAEITRCILDSMALAIGRAVREATTISGRQVEAVHLVGGGVANRLFCQLVADATGLPVVAGPVEAAAWGNAMYQAMAFGALEASPAAGRDLIRAVEPASTFQPADDTRAWSSAADALRELAATR